ncbi:DUF1553 domain-containing protein [Armatimonas sp.]|uniref:DUF1553 domain-containing protein n=1 Tax=Armatimonas sp. TaxID=1872638 RepID=UPI00374DC1B2
MSNCHHSRNVIRFAPSLLALAALLTVGLYPRSARSQNPVRTNNPEEYWHSQVEPLLDKSCLKCHAGVRQSGGLDLRSLDTILRGGDSGPAVIPGKPGESRLVQYVLPQPGPHMPPDPKKQLSPEAINTLKTWIALLPVQTEQTKSVPQYMQAYQRSLPSLGAPPTNLTPSATIDWFVQAGWKKEKLTPARPTSDAVFARRLYLDLAGRIPTSVELRQFVGDYHGDKRELLVTKLLASEDYPRHFREVFDTTLMGRGAGKNALWSTFLEDAFRTNRPWSAIVRDILVARPMEKSKQGAVWFLAARQNSFQAIAEAVAPVAFGVKIGCAQCHNHPLAWEIEQRHYWGLVAAFNRGKNVDTDSGTGISESAIGGFINFANLKKESQAASLVFLNGKSISERVPAANEKEMDKPELYLVPPGTARTAAVPKFSRRESFADSVTKENPLLARAFVNRIWAKLMGRGFVQPADQLDSKHRPSHPELLEWLARDFETSGYNIQRLVKNIVLTRAYQLDAKTVSKTPPPPESFARALEKPLSAEQLLHSLQVATAAKLDNPETEKLERGFVKAFPDLMPDTYNPSLQQALFLTNSPLVDKLLKPIPGNTTTKLAALPTPERQVREAFQVSFGRLPDATELQQCQTILKTASSPERGVQNLLWALLTSAEFQVNH